MSGSEECPYVSRGGLKLAAALEAFDIDPSGRTCADLGCNVGGFTDCLLQHGAARVYAVDTGYGELAWTLRKDTRVVVMERTNALHVELPESVDLAVIDVGWTRQHFILPAGRRLVRDGGWIITLIKPHYEAEANELRKGILPSEMIDVILERVRTRAQDIGIAFERMIESPIKGQKGNREFLGLVKQ